MNRVAGGTVCTPGHPVASLLNSPERKRFAFLQSGILEVDQLQSAIAGRARGWSFLSKYKRIECAFVSDSTHSNVDAILARLLINRNILAGMRVIGVPSAFDLSGDETAHRMPRIQKIGYRAIP
jgi:hypothetical protein